MLSFFFTLVIINIPEVINGMYISGNLWCMFPAYYKINQIFYEVNMHGLESLIVLPDRLCKIINQNNNATTCKLIK